MVGRVTRSQSRNAAAGEPAATAKTNVPVEAQKTAAKKTKEDPPKKAALTTGPSTMATGNTEDKSLETKKTIQIEACNISCPE